MNVTASSDAVAWPIFPVTYRIWFGQEVGVKAAAAKIPTGLLYPFLANTDLQQIFANDELPVKTMLSGLQFFRSSVPGHDVTQHQHRYARIRRDLAHLFNRSVSIKQMVMYGFLNFRSRRGQYLVNPCGQNDFVNEYVRAPCKTDQIFANAGIPREAYPPESGAASCGDRRPKMAQYIKCTDAISGARP